MLRQIGIAEGGADGVADQGNATGTADENNIIDVGQAQPSTLARAGQGFATAIDCAIHLVADETMEYVALDGCFQRNGLTSGGVNQFRQITLDTLGITQFDLDA